MTALLPDPGRVSARRALTREKLMAAAVGVFAEHGIPGASVEEICEAAGFTRGAFYSNFADKDALVLALIRHSIDSQYEAAEQAIGRMRDAPAGLSPGELVSSVLADFDTLGGPGREMVLAQQELLLHAARQPALHAPYQAFATACAERLDALIADAMTEARLEFTVPFGEAIQLLIAVHGHAQTQALFTGVASPAPLQSLIMAITRPV